MPEDRECPRCGGQQVRDNQDKDALSCLQCGNLVYDEPPAKYETDRRSRTDNRQLTKPFEEYRRGMSDEEFEEAFKEVMEESP